MVELKEVWYTVPHDAAAAFRSWRALIYKAGSMAA